MFNGLALAGSGSL